MKFELTKQFLNDVIQKLDRQEFELVKNKLSKLHNVDIAELIEELDDEHGKILFELFEVLEASFWRVFKLFFCAKYRFLKTFSKTPQNTALVSFKSASSLA